MMLKCFLLQGVLFTVLFINSLVGLGQKCCIKLFPWASSARTPGRQLWSSIQTSNKKSHSLFPPFSENSNKTIFKGYGNWDRLQDNGRREGKETQHGKQKQQQGRDTKRHSPLFRVPGCIVLFRYVTALFFRFGEWRRRGDWLKSMAVTKAGNKLKVKHSRPSNLPTS